MQRREPARPQCTNTVTCNTRAVVYATVISTLTASTTLQGQDGFTVLYSTVGLTSTYTYVVYTTTIFSLASTSITVSGDTVTLYPTQTTTSTVSPATATVYAACATNNIANVVNGTGITEADYSALGDGITVNTEADCCAACQTTPNCGGSLFIPSNQPNCNLVGIAGVCTVTHLANITLGIPGGGFFISGGVCGRWAVQPRLPLAL